MDKTCGNCEYYSGGRVLDSSIGQCRRYPPKQDSGEFAPMRVDEWCGEHSEGQNLTNYFKKICDILCREDVSGGG